MTWQDRLVCDPEVLGGKMVVRGTRLSVEFLLECLAGGWSPRTLLDEYPQLAEEDLAAVFAYAAGLAREEFPLPPSGERAA